MNSSFIIIVTYNGMPWIEKCLKSCGDYQVVVVDNASSDETVSFIKGKFPKVQILHQTKNLGFGQANNTGIVWALQQGAEHFFLLNQDAYLIDDCLQKLITFQKANPAYGIVSPIHITANQKKLDKNFSSYLTSQYNSDFYSDYVLKQPLKPVYPVPFVNAAAWLLSEEIINTVGGFDPLFFHYGEDDNYCQRVTYHNFKIGILPECFIIHDRVDREAAVIDLFSEAYYNQQERSCKVKYANINDPMGLNNLKGVIDGLKKRLLKLKLKGKFGKLAPLKKEMELYEKIEPQIKKSRDLNAKKGQTHLQI
ncbi:glycosyltransferase family 2 protein [Ulvibacter antarcticus]|uniref:GT2 family glycosyltransferase n=1 Tax=Ulvibacter antarcticus TaxID=442714 RepID=A0A3L9YB73_9FLAO|nr:glycosyltransferase family 2 protein [Ulvibacter antarcticus]RMA57973.1 GT2 family glycosyltransferase [Ulvibacter antarcticus]